MTQQIKTKGLPKLQDVSSRLNIQKCVQVYSKTTACQHLAFNKLNTTILKKRNQEYPTELKFSMSFFTKLVLNKYYLAISSKKVLRKNVIISVECVLSTSKYHVASTPSKQQAWRRAILYPCDKLHKSSYIIKCTKSCWLAQKRIYICNKPVYNLPDFRIHFQLSSQTITSSTSSMFIQNIYPTYTPLLQWIQGLFFLKCLNPAVNLMGNTKKKQKKKEFYLQDYHSACPLSINLSLNRQDRFMSK